MCPVPLERAPGVVVPRRIRLVNETPDTLDVWLDRCFRHTRLGTVPPGATLQPRLPERLIAFPEGLRLHTTRVRGWTEHFGVFVVPVRPVPVLEAVLVDSARALPTELQEVSIGGATGMAPVTVSGDGGRSGSTALFSRDGLGVLTWSCIEDGPLALSLSLRGETAAGTLSVGWSVDRLEIEASVPWDRAAGPGGAVLRAPDAVARDFTRAASMGATASVRIEAEGTSPLFFDLGGLEAELETLGCAGGD
jgi:hypothetical protein